MEKVWMKDGKFIELKAEEMEKLTPEQLVEYKKDQIKSQVLEILKDYNPAKSEDVKRVTDEIEKLKESQELAEIKANLEGLSAVVKHFSVTDNKPVRSTRQNLEKAWSAIKEDEKVSVEKAVTTTQTAVTDNTMNYQVPGIARTPSPRFAIEELFPMVVVNDPNSFDELTYRDWDEASISRAAAARTEGNAVPTSDLVMKEYTVQMKTISDSVDLTTAAWSRSDIFARDVEYFLNDNMARIINSTLYADLYARVDAFNHAAYSGKTTIEPNIADLGLVLKTEIMDGKDNPANGYNVNFAFITWNDYLDLAGFLKNANSDYIIPPQHGINYIPSSFVTADTALFGDSSKAKVYTTQKYEMEIGYKSGNFEKRVRSLLVDATRYILVREAEKDAFLKVTSVASALAAIETV